MEHIANRGVTILRWATVNFACLGSSESRYLVVYSRTLALDKLNAPILWSQICDFIPEENHGFWCLWGKEHHLDSSAQLARARTARTQTPGPPAL